VEERVFQNTTKYTRKCLSIFFLSRKFLFYFVNGYWSSITGCN